MLKDELGELDEKHRRFVTACELCAPQNHTKAYRWIGNGCPPSDRLALRKAYIAKAVWDFATTRDLIDAIRHRPALRRLCGWETLGQVPSEATFSRAFDAFAGNAGVVKKMKRHALSLAERLPQRDCATAAGRVTPPAVKSEGSDKIKLSCQS